MCFKTFTEMYNKLTEFLDTFENVSRKPQEFLRVQDELGITVKQLTKKLYDFTKSNEDQKDKKALPELIVEHFDEEQIWQELELQNGNCTEHIIPVVSQLSAKKENLVFPIKFKSGENKTKNRADFQEDEEKDVHSEIDDYEKNINIEMGDEEKEMGKEEDEINNTTDDDASEKVSNNFKRTSRPSVVDDKFFKLSELELFLNIEEKNEDKPDKSLGAIDLFDNTDEGSADYKYSDFFENPEGVPSNLENTVEHSDNDVDEEGYLDDFDDDENDYDDSENVNEKKTKRKRSGSGNEEYSEDESDAIKNSKSNKKVRFSLLGSDEESSDAETTEASGSKNTKLTTKKSTLEERQERLGRVIEKLEEEALSEKPWQLTGEVTSSSRPQNSLLEEIVDFDVSVRPAPVITGEVTLRLEDIIMQRIKDKAWDDVERKVKPVDTPTEFKKRLALDQEKSKLSLAEVYEQEFIKQREAATADDTERQEAEPALHVEVRSMLHTLFNKLDALSNYHYTPRPVAPELKVVTNVAAITMEEVAPITVADSALLAPQEIKGKKRRTQLMSKEEQTATDRKRARRLKKTKQRRQFREKQKTAKEIAKINPGLGNKYSKLNAEKQILEGTKNVSKMEESKEKTVRSSTAFFNKLQEEVNDQIKSKSSSFAKKKDKHNITAKKLKL